MRSVSIRLVVSCLAMIVGIELATKVAACPICIGLPSKTEADVLLGSHCVLLGRPDPTDPFQYVPGVALRGTYDGSSIDLLVDSATHRTLEAHPEFQMLLIQESPQGPWRIMGPMNQAFEALVRRILAAGSSWNGPEGLKNRIDFFVSLLGHEDDRISELAYLELGRAPYSTVRQLGRILPREAYEPMLSNRRYLEWRGLAILLLAQSQAESDRKFILESFGAAERNAVVTNLAALTAAAIEVDTNAMLDQIVEKYFRRKDRKPEELQAIFLALSMHGSRDDTELRERIVVSYGRLLEATPELAPQVAEDLYAWKRSELSEVLADILDQRRELLDPSGISKVQRYVRSVMVADSTGRLHD